MKIISSIRVEHLDLETFEILPGYEDFKEHYKSKLIYLKSGFHFTDMTERDQAILMLNQSKLSYKIYYKIELETELELKNYPIVAIVFNTTKFPVILEEKGKIQIGSKISKKNFHLDIGSGKLIFSEKAMRFFESKVPDIQFTQVFDSTKKMAYYILENVRTIQNPKIYSGNTTISLCENNTYRIENNDDRFDYSEESIAEVKESKFMLEDSFMFEGKKYLFFAESYVCSGEFAFEIHQHFNFEKDACSFFIPTLKFV